MNYIMKKLFIWCVFSLLFSVNAYSNDISRLEIFISKGVAFIDYKLPECVNDKSEYNISGGIVFNWSPTLSLVVTIDYNKFHGSEISLFGRYDPIEYQGIKRTESFNILAASAYLKLSLIPTTKRISWYLLHGVGRMDFMSKRERVPFYSTSTNDYVPSDEKEILKSKDFAFSMIWGTGVDIRIIQSIRFFTEVNFIVGFMDGPNTELLTLKTGVQLRVPDKLPW